MTTKIKSSNLDANLEISGTFTANNIVGNADALTNVSKFFTATVEGSGGTSDWTGTEPSIATLTVNGIKATDRPIVDIDLSSVAFVDVEIIQANWALVYRVEASADDEIKLYATEEPVSTFNILIKVVR